MRRYKSDFTTAKEPAKLMSLSNVTRSGLVSFGKTCPKNYLEQELQLIIF